MLREWWPLISSVGLVIGGLGAAAWAIISGFKKRTELANQRLDTAQAELVAVMKLEAEAWKNRYEGEHEEFLTYRQKAHDTANECQAKILALASENAELKSKTDLSPILQFHREQSSINSKLVETLDAILEKLNGRKGAT